MEFWITGILVIFCSFCSALILYLFEKKLTADEIMLKQFQKNCVSLAIKIRGLEEDLQSHKVRTNKLAMALAEMKEVIPKSAG